MNTGSIVDFYDDPNGTVLKTKLAYVQIPDYVRQARYQDHEKLASLPDDAFALVMVDQGHKLRKFACVDKGNTALSVIYFLENKDKLPEEAQKVAAANLLAYCEAFGLEAPFQLQKVAEVSGTDIMPLQSSPAEDDAPISSKKISCGGSMKTSGCDVDDGEDASIGQAKTAGRLVPKEKTASAHYVDVTGKAPMPHLVKHASHRYCLVKEGSGKFPIDSYGQVLEANRWFEENGNTLHPADRREYCTKLASRADELGIMVTDKIRKYAGTKYASEGDVKIAVATRMQFWTNEDKEHGVLEGLMGKYASVQPEVFCSALEQFDEATGLSHYWDSQIPDPYLSTFGFEKKAEWQWNQGADRLNEQDLMHGVQDADKIYQIKQRFGEDMAQGLAKDPKAVFDSLPLDTKKIISRLFSDPQS